MLEPLAPVRTAGPPSLSAPDPPPPPLTCASVTPGKLAMLIDFNISNVSRSTWEEAKQAADQHVCDQQASERHGFLPAVELDVCHSGTCCHLLPRQAPAKCPTQPQSCPASPRKNSANTKRDP